MMPFSSGPDRTTTRSQQKRRRHSSSADAAFSPTSCTTSTTSTQLKRMTLPKVLFELLEQQEDDAQKILTWDKEGHKVLLPNIQAFEESSILSTYFPHLATLSQFVQEMETYGFQSESSLSSSASHPPDSSVTTKGMVFQHPRFHRDNREPSIKIRKRKNHAARWNNNNNNNNQKISSTTTNDYYDNDVGPLQKTRRKSRQKKHKSDHRYHHAVERFVGSLDQEDFSLASFEDQQHQDEEEEEQEEIAFGLDVELPATSLHDDDDDDDEISLPVLHDHDGNGNEDEVLLWKPSTDQAVSPPLPPASLGYPSAELLLANLSPPPPISSMMAGISRPPPPTLQHMSSVLSNTSNGIKMNHTPLVFSMGGPNNRRYTNNIMQQQHLPQQSSSFMSLEPDPIAVSASTHASYQSTSSSLGLEPTPMRRHNNMMMMSSQSSFSQQPQALLPDNSHHKTHFSQVHRNFSQPAQPRAYHPQSYSHNSSSISQSSFQQQQIPAASASVHTVAWQFSQALGHDFGRPQDLERTLTAQTMDTLFD